MDHTKEAHNARKKAITAEKEARLKRLADISGELTASVEEITNVHNFLSILEQEKHSGKGMINNDLSNAIGQLASALTSINKYERQYNEKSPKKS